MEKEANSDNVQTRPVQCNGAINLLLVLGPEQSPVWSLAADTRGEPDWTSLAHLVVTQSIYMHVIGNIVYVYKREEVDTQLSGIETV